MIGYTDNERRVAEPVNRHEFDGYTTWVKNIDEKLILHTQQEIRMEHRLDELEKDVGEIKTDVKQLLEIWTEAKGAMRFLTVLVSLLAAGWTAVLWTKDHIRL